MVVSSSFSATLRAGLNSSKAGCSLSSTANSARAALSPPFAVFCTRSRRRSTVARSASASSIWMVSMSRRGSIESSTWTTVSLSKQRTTETIVSVSRIACRNWFPMPSPCEEPRTRPAMSTNSTLAGTITSVFTNFASGPNRSSGTATTPTFGLLVENA